MKKLFILGLVLLMVVVFASTFVIAEEGEGAVKVDLNLRTGGEDPDAPGDGPAAGWAIINTTADGKLQIEVHMYDAPEGTYDFHIVINLPPQENFPGPYPQLTTNKNGICNAHFEYEIPEDIPEDAVSLTVKLNVKSAGTGGKVGYASGVKVVPLKK